MIDIRTFFFFEARVHERVVAFCHLVYRVLSLHVLEMLLRAELCDESPPVETYADAKDHNALGHWAPIDSELSEFNIEKGEEATQESEDVELADRYKENEQRNQVLLYDHALFDVK